MYLQIVFDEFTGMLENGIGRSLFPAQSVNQNMHWCTAIYSTLIHSITESY